jgi:AICAR transformylase/IMP cyclohydrolase PurH (only IMP cyclohydrolase domain in Aful)
VAQLADLGIEPFDLVVSNLYPFTDTVSSGATQEECIEQIDIGGPSMVRAAAKNHASVAIVTSPAEYGSVLVAVRGGGFTLGQRKTLAAEAFVHTASYDFAVASWMGSVLTDTSDGTGFPAWVGATWTRATVLRYGENPHQKAALYAHWRPGIATAEQLHGKEMSYNNFIDADAAQRAAYDHAEPAVAISSTPTPAVSRSEPTSRRPTGAPTRATRSRRTAVSSRPTAPSRQRWRSRLPRVSPRSSSPLTTSPRRWRSFSARRRFVS